MKETELILSALPKTWIIDLDGTIVKHNGYLIDGKDSLLDGSKEFFRRIPPTDYVIITTSRKKDYENITIQFLKENGIRYDTIIWGIPPGERILVNDEKPSGLKTAYAINKKRDEALNLHIVIDSEI